ncbi:unnamed protein product [Nezara viridula]|uniref:Neuropeptide n=1 Tax=Nezara viridula TaxID=85310 RepID=A0A9P0HPG2_NEZVI|nr:unnamed protein product [Nezara viridula]
MILITGILIFVQLSVYFPTIVECKETYPKKCYTCTSLVSSRLCGDDFRKLNFLVKDCTPDKKYCIKLVETAGSSAFMYRKCTANTCEQEKQFRQGHVTECSVCTTTLCNEGSTPHQAMMLLSSVFWYHYINS